MSKACLVIATVATAAALVGAERMAAQIPACYVPGSGTVYVINTVGAPAACATSHIPVNLQGPPGQTGPSGVATITVVEKDSTMGPGTASFTLICPTGTIALSSGYTMNPIGSSFGIPNNFRVGDAWAFTVYNISSPPVNVSLQLLLYCGSP